MLRTLLLGLAAASVLATGAAAAAFRPDDETLVLERLPAIRASVPATAIGTDLERAVAVATAWTELAQRTQDSRWAGRAQAALAAWWELETPPLPVLRLRALLRQHRHDFTGALADLDLAVRLAPADPQARLARASVRLVFGEPVRAGEDCGALAELRAGLVANVCAGLVQARTGRAALAAVLLDGALGDGAEVPEGLRVFAFTARAEAAAASGDRPTARRWYEAAVRAAPDDAFARQALADHLLATGEAAAVAAVIQPTDGNDGDRLRLVLAARALGAPDAAAEADLVARHAASRLRGDTLAAREEARFRLARGETAEALRLAVENFTTQREPIDAALLLRAAEAAGDPAAALPARAWIARTGIEPGALTAALGAP